MILTFGLKNDELFGSCSLNNRATQLTNHISQFWSRACNFLARYKICVLFDATFLYKKKNFLIIIINFFNMA